MTNINTQLGGTGYYQLNSQQTGANGTGKSAGNVPALASALLQASNPEANSQSNAAYLLDLSPQARQYLASNNQPASPASALNVTEQFTLSSKQHQQITQIIVKYKDEPFTQETFNRIQDELADAGLGVQQLAMVDKATSFNPTQILVNALSGRGAGSVLNEVNGANVQTKSANYMQQIISQWRNISTTVNDPLTGDDVVAPGSGTSGT